MQAAKQLIYAGLARARGQLCGGQAGVLVDFTRQYCPASGAAAAGRPSGRAVRQSQVPP